MDLLEMQVKDERAEVRGRSEVILRRAASLPQAQRTLLEMTLSGRMSRREVAKLLGIPGGTVSRRVRRLVTRLCDPLVVALLEGGHNLPADYRRMGIEYFVQKQSIERVAELHRMSRRRAAGIIHYIEGWLRSDLR